MNENKKVKKWQWITLLVIVILGVGLRFYQNYLSDVKVELKNQTLNVLVARTIYQQHKGLGGRENLDGYDGMIFPYNSLGKYGFVMRDMKFSIDIVWLANGVVVDIAPNLPLENVPEAQLTKYYPRKEANLVLELPAGWADQNSLKIGDKIALVHEDLTNIK